MLKSLAHHARPSTREDQDDHPHACLEGVVYIGHLIEDEDGDDVEMISAIPCRRCAAAAR